MPDFSMCQAKSCRISDTCRRHTDSGTTPNQTRQSYADFSPSSDSPGCDAYWHVNQMSIMDSGGDIAPDEDADGRIVRKAIEDYDA